MDGFVKICKVLNLYGCVGYAYVYFWLSSDRYGIFEKVLVDFKKFGLGLDRLDRFG